MSPLSTAYWLLDQANLKGRNVLPPVEGNDGSLTVGSLR